MRKTIWKDRLSSSKKSQDAIPSSKRRQRRLTEVAEDLGQGCPTWGASPSRLPQDTQREDVGRNQRWSSGTHQQRQHSLLGGSFVTWMQESLPSTKTSSAGRGLQSKAAFPGVKRDKDTFLPCTAGPHLVHPCTLHCRATVCESVRGKLKLFFFFLLLLQI